MVKTFFCSAMLIAYVLMVTFSVDLQGAEHRHLVKSEIVQTARGGWVVRLAAGGIKPLNAEISFPREVSQVDLDEHYVIGTHLEGRSRLGAVETRWHVFVEQTKPTFVIKTFFNQFFDCIVPSEVPLHPEISARAVLPTGVEGVMRQPFRADVSPWTGRQSVSYFDIYQLDDVVLIICATVMWSPWRVRPTEQHWAAVHNFLADVTLAR